MANRADPDETPRSVASHLGLHFLLRPVCPNTSAKCGIWRDTIDTSESSDRTTWMDLRCQNVHKVTFSNGAALAYFFFFFFFFSISRVLGAVFFYC